MKMCNSKSEIKTKVLKTFILDKKNKLTIEKVGKGKLCGQYIVRSYTKKFLGSKLTTLASIDITTDFNGSVINGMEYPIFNMLRQAIDYAKYVKKNKYTEVY